jgi:flagellar biosynthesis protein FlhF
MYLKRFLRPTVREALAAARETLGPHALVLSTELVQAPGWRGWTGHRVVALTAALDRPVPENREDDVDLVEAGASRLVSDERPEASALRQLDGDPARTGLVARLTASGIDPRIAAATAARLSPADCRTGSSVALEQALAAALAEFSPASDVEPRVEVFIGPPGVGKTTTIAKIAAQSRIAGRHPEGVIAADGSRIGAVEHLRGYAAIIGSPFRIARDASELSHAIKAARRPVLVDTAGRLPSDPGLCHLLAGLSSRPDVMTHLVLAADTSADSAMRILDRYAEAKPNRVVITKLDEAHSAAPLLGAIYERRIPVSYVGSGPNVPRDLVRATPNALAAVMLGDSLQGAMTCH